MQDISGMLGAYAEDRRTGELSTALLKDRARIQLKGLIGSSDAWLASALFHQAPYTGVFVLADQEEATYFLSDLENFSGRTALLFPASCKKPYDFSLPDSYGILQRTDVLNELQQARTHRLIVTYPEALAEKVINHEALEQNTLEVRLGDKLDIGFINEFLSEYGFERVDFVYEAGQFSIRGGIVDIFSFSHELPYRVEFFGNQVESIRSFDIESQLSERKLTRITVVPNIQSDILKQNNTTITDFLELEAVFWFKDIEFCFDSILRGVEKARGSYRKIVPDEIAVHPEWLDPLTLYESAKVLRGLTEAFRTVEFGKQFTLNDQTKL